MSKFTFMVWNVRHFKGERRRLDEVDRFISNVDPDCFGLIEYQGKSSILELMVDRFPEYDFAVTDSTGNLEVVVGYRRGKFDQVVWTQKRKFNDRKRVLRPGALISLRCDGEFYNLLFLHADSGNTATDYANRKAVFSKVWKLREALQRRSATGRANLIVLGDLNTMGRGKTISGQYEINWLARTAEKKKMKLLEKDAKTTWSQWGKGPRGNRRKLKVAELDGLKESDLDHVIASDDVSFVTRGDNEQPIHVEGWQQLDGAAKTSFLWNLSDHCALVGEVS